MDVHNTSNADDFQIDTHRYQAKCLSGLWKHIHARGRRTPSQLDRTQQEQDAAELSGAKLCSQGKEWRFSSGPFESASSSVSSVVCTEAAMSD